jgi:hypothetical protein
MSKKPDTETDARRREKPAPARVYSAEMITELSPNGLPKVVRKIPPDVLTAAFNYRPNRGG